MCNLSHLFYKFIHFIIIFNLFIFIIDIFYWHVRILFGRRLKKQYEATLLNWGQVGAGGVRVRWGWRSILRVGGREERWSSIENELRERGRVCRTGWTGLGEVSEQASYTQWKREREREIFTFQVISFSLWLYLMSEEEVCVFISLQMKNELKNSSFVKETID